MGLLKYDVKIPPKTFPAKGNKLLERFGRKAPYTKIHCMLRVV